MKTIAMVHKDVVESLSQVSSSDLVILKTLCKSLETRFPRLNRFFWRDVKMDSRGTLNAYCRWTFGGVGVFYAEGVRDGRQYRVIFGIRYPTSYFAGEDLSNTMTGSSSDEVPGRSGNA